MNDLPTLARTLAEAESRAKDKTRSKFSRVLASLKCDDVLRENLPLLLDVLAEVQAWREMAFRYGIHEKYEDKRPGSIWDDVVQARARVDSRLAGEGKHGD